MDKAEWYTRGFERFGWRVRFAMWLVRLFYKLRLITEEDVKMYSNMVINAWLIEQTKKYGVRIKTIEIGENDS